MIERLKKFNPTNSNWTESDPSSLAYIENRPGFEDRTAIDFTWLAPEVGDFEILELWAPHDYTIEGIAIKCDLETAEISISVDDTDVQFNNSASIPVTTDKTAISSTSNKNVVYGKTIKVTVNALGATTTKIYGTLMIKGIPPADLVGTPFIFSVETATPNESFTLPTSETWWTYDNVEETINYNAMVDYGDGSGPVLVDSFNSANATHVYATPGTYDIKIYGLFEAFAPQSDIGITEVKQWGTNSGFKALNLAYQAGLAAIPTGPITGLGEIPDLSYMFYDCALITSIPANIFENAITCIHFGACFAGTGITEIPANLFSTNIAALCFGSTFERTAIITIPETLFANNINAEDFTSVFYQCSNLISIPENLFKYNVNATNFGVAFESCPITEIPEDLFRYNIEAIQFDRVFGYTNIASIPATLFSSCPNVTSFSGAFNACTLLTAIPVDIFRYNTLVNSFSGCFSGNTVLVTIPNDLFRYNTAVTDFSAVFNACQSLESIPALIFKYNTLAVNFVQALSNCEKLQVNRNIFYDDGEQNTRFLDKSVNFNQCLYRGYYQVGFPIGEAPDLWNCSFGTGVPDKTSCFAGEGNSLTSLSNYAAIPADWIN